MNSFTRSTTPALHKLGMQLKNGSVRVIFGVLPKIQGLFLQTLVGVSHFQLGGSSMEF